jgi:hypothetical protein
MLVVSQLPLAALADGRSVPLSAYGGLGEPLAPFRRNGKQGGGVDYLKISAE